MGKLKILLWSSRGAGKHYYGPGTNAYNLYRSVRRLADIGLVLVHANPEQETNEIYDEVIDLGNYPNFEGLARYRYLWESWKTLWRLRRKGYIFHGLDTYMAIFLPALFAKLLGFPVVLKVAGSPSGLSASRYRVISGFRRFCARFIDRFLVISPEIRDELLGLKIASKNLAMVYNGVDVIRFQNAMQSAEHDGKRFKLLFTGAVCRRKRPHFLLEALHESGVSSRWSIDLVGPIQDEDYLKEMQLFLMSVGMVDQVVFHGYSSEIDVYYRQSDLYGLPSTCEGMPNGVLEAMASGLPLAISPFSSASLLCDGKNGAILESISDYAQFIAEMTRAPEMLNEMGRQSRALVQQAFSMDAVAQSYLTCFEELES